MSFDYKDYNRIARQLSDQGVDKSPDKEAKLRCAISRAYYAAFLTARQFLGIKDRGDRSSHATVHNALLDRDERKLKEAGNNLRSMKFKREQADYDDEISNLEREAIMVLTMSSNIINNISATTNKPDKNL